MTAPAAPTNVVLQTGNGQNLVSWPIVSGANSYIVQRSIDGVNFTTVGTPLVAQYLDTTVLIGVSYYYQVAATNGTPSAYVASYPASIVPCLPCGCALAFCNCLANLVIPELNLVAVPAMASSFDMRSRYAAASTKPCQKAVSFCCWLDWE